MKTFREFLSESQENKYSNKYSIAYDRLDDILNKVSDITGLSYNRATFIDDNEGLSSRDIQKSYNSSSAEDFADEAGDLTDEDKETIYDLFSEIADMASTLSKFVDKNSELYYKNYPFYSADNNYKPINYSFASVKEAYEFLGARLKDTRRVSISL